MTEGQIHLLQDELGPETENIDNFTLNSQRSFSDTESRSDSGEEEDYGITFDVDAHLCLLTDLESETSDSENVEINVLEEVTAPVKAEGVQKVKIPVVSKAAKKTLGELVPGTASDQPDPNIPIMPEVGSKVILGVQIEGIGVEALGDTGAQASLLPQWFRNQVVATYGQRWWEGRRQDSNARLQSASGQDLENRGVYNLTLTDGYATVVVPFHVNSNEYTQKRSNRTRILLGTNALRGLGILMTSASGELLMTPSHYQIPLQVTVDTQEGPQKVYDGTTCVHPMGITWPSESTRQREKNTDIPEPMILPKPKGINSPSRKVKETDHEPAVLPETENVWKKPEHSPERLRQLQNQKHAAQHLPTKNIPELRQRKSPQKKEKTVVNVILRRKHSPSPKDVSLGGVHISEEQKVARYESLLKGCRRVPQVSFALKSQVRLLPTVYNRAGERIAAEDVPKSSNFVLRKRSADRARAEAPHLYHVLSAKPLFPLGVTVDEMESSSPNIQGGGRCTIRIRRRREC